MSSLHSCAPIMIGCDDQINNVSFDGCNYFCTIKCKCEIVKLNKRLKPEHTYRTRREYDCICYDWGENCWWASSKDCFNRIFKLDGEMNEIDCIDIENVCRICFTCGITGLSYNCCKDALLVSYADSVIEVDKKREEATVLYSPKRGWIMGVLSLCPYTLVTVQTGRNYYVEVLDSCGERLGGYAIKAKSEIKNLIFNPCGPKRRRPEIEVVFLERCSYPRICKWDISFDDLELKPCRCNYEICDESRCDDPDPDPERDPCAAILESIALVEASIAHILNAEGEKLQKILSVTDDIDKILRVNREVNNTIINATHLEHVLHAKLSRLMDSGICDESFCGEFDGLDGCGGEADCRGDEP